MGAAAAALLAGALLVVACIAVVCQVCVFSGHTHHHPPLRAAAVAFPPPSTLLPFRTCEVTPTHETSTPPLAVASANTTTDTKTNILPWNHRHRHGRGISSSSRSSKPFWRAPSAPGSRQAKGRRPSASSCSARISRSRCCQTRTGQLASRRSRPLAKRGTVACRRCSTPGDGHRPQLSKSARRQSYRFKRRP